MNMKKTNFEMSNTKRSKLPVAVLSVAACAAILFGSCASSDNKPLTENDAGAASAAQDSVTSISAADSNDNIIPEKTESSASEIIQSEAAADSIAENSVPSDNGEADSKADIANVPESQPKKVEMSVEKMLSMDGAQLRALSNDEYEIIDGASDQTASFGLKCAAFPEYVFVLQRVDYLRDKPENTIKVPHDDYVFELSDKIEQLNLYDGAEVGSGVKVGMTYNEIEKLLGHDI